MPALTAASPPVAPVPAPQASRGHPNIEAEICHTAGGRCGQPHAERSSVASAGQQCGDGARVLPVSHLRRASTSEANLWDHERSHKHLRRSKRPNSHRSAAAPLPHRALLLSKPRSSLILPAGPISSPPSRSFRRGCLPWPLLCTAVAPDVPALAHPTCSAPARQPRTWAPCAACRAAVCTRVSPALASDRICCLPQWTSV